MLTGIAFLLVLLTVPLFGGKLSLLARVRPRRSWALVASLGLQFAVFTLFSSQIPEDLGRYAHLASYGFALIFVHANWRIPGMLVLVTGGLLNLAAIAANGGLMPASAEALERAGKIDNAEEFKNSTEVEGARLQFLGDIFAIPDGVPFANVFSIGDIVLVVGGGILVHSVGGSRVRPRRDRLRLDRSHTPHLCRVVDRLRQHNLDFNVPEEIDLVDGFDVRVTRDGRNRVLLCGQALLHFVTEQELEALILHASARHTFGANDAFDLAPEHELEASSVVASVVGEAIGYALCVRAALRTRDLGVGALLELQDRPIDPSGATLGDHLSAIGLAVPRSRQEAEAFWDSRRSGPNAARLLHPSGVGALSIVGAAGQTAGQAAA